MDSIAESIVMIGNVGMSDKALLVMNMPENCDKCKIRAINLAWCNVARKSTSHHPSGKPIDERKRPYWCPLKPIPEKKPVVLDALDSFGNGWNECINKILE